jgi:hypothetical protein
MFKALMVLAILQSTVNQAMSQSNCDFVKIAEDYVRQRWPFIDVTTERRAVSEPSGAYWQVTFKLPDDTLGYVPEVRIDRRTCQVVGAQVWQ